MAYENINWGMPQQAAQARQAQFADMVGKGMQAAQFQQQMDLKERQLAGEGNEFDLNKKAQLEIYKRQQGLPHDENIIRAASDWKGSQTYFDQMKQRMVTDPTLADRVGLGQMSGGNTNIHNAPQNTTPFIPQGIDVGGQQFQPVAESQLNANVDYSSAPTPTPPRPNMQSPQQGYDAVAMPDIPIISATGALAGTGLGQREAMEANLDIAKDVAKGTAAARIQQQKEFATKKFEKNQATPIIKKTLTDLTELNDKLNAKKAVISNDAGVLQNLKTKYGTTWVGRQTQSVTNPAIEGLRQEYERKRDSLIPYYISFHDLPATVVDTEEFQQRILNAFGDPTLQYEANDAAINNMKFQFGIEERAAPNNQGVPKASAPQGAVDKLLQDPSLAPMFDAKYGAGASKQFLGGS